MATDPKDNKEAKDEKPKEHEEELTEEQAEDVAGGKKRPAQAYQPQREEGWGRYAKNE